MEMNFTLNQDYADALIENSEFHKKVRAGKANYLSQAYIDLKRRLVKHELSMSSKEIIQHAEHLFPEVGE